MALNRELQLDILRLLENEYPARLSDIHNQFADPDAAIRNIHYLHEHGLIDATFSGALGRRVQVPGPIRINSRGMDFLADDGGLSAILGVVTVKLHEDTLRQIISAKIEGSDLPEEEKRPLLQAVRELPGEAIKHLSEKLLDLGLDNLPGAAALIYTVLQTGPGS